MLRNSVRLGSALLGTVTAIALAGCSTPATEPSQTPAPPTVTVTESAEPAPSASPETSATDDPTTSAPPQTTEPTAEPNTIADRVAQVAEIDPAPYRSDLIYPSQTGLQFTGPDGTFCEIYGEGVGAGGPSALCTHQGEGDVNAVSVRQGEPASVHNVNRIFMADEQTVALAPGARLVDGPVSCAIEEGSVQVLCAIGEYGFAVDMTGVELA